jgi:hypothetical protein
VDGTGGTSLRLHLNDLNGVAKDVLAASSGPLVNIVGHGAGGGDGVNASNLGKGVADVGGSGVAVHGFKFSSQNEYLLKYYKFCPTYHITFMWFCKAVKGNQKFKIGHLHKINVTNLYSLQKSLL